MSSDIQKPDNRKFNRVTCKVLPEIRDTIIKTMNYKNAVAHLWLDSQEGKTRHSY